MKDYGRLVIWLDYFNSKLSRAQGRKVPVSKAVRDPTLDELRLAAERLGCKPEVVEAKHPKRIFTQSGYISVEKRGKEKVKLLKDLANSLSSVRGESSARKPSSG